MNQLDLKPTEYRKKNPRSGRWQFRDNPRHCFIMMCVALGMLAGTSGARAQVLFNCGPSSGYSYFLEGGINSSGEEKWEEDRISSGGIQLLVDGTEYDIVYTDALGGRSARADGGNVIGFIAEAGALVIVAYPNVVETYQFNFDSKKVAWTQNKAHPISRKIAAFVSECQ